MAIPTYFESYAKKQFKSDRPRSARKIPYTQKFITTVNNLRSNFKSPKSAIYAKIYSQNNILIGFIIFLVVVDKFRSGDKLKLAQFTHMNFYVYGIFLVPYVEVSCGLPL